MNARRSALRAALTAALALSAVGGGPAPSVAEDPLARAIVEQRARAVEFPSDARVHNDLGNLLALVGDAQGAEAAYRRALELDPDSPTAHYNLGRLLAATGERRAARRALLRAIELDPGNAAARYHLGALYDDWHRPRAARRWYRRAFELDPTLSDPAKNPHVVDNRQALAALLLTWSKEHVPGPSRQYEQPRQVVAAVVPAEDAAAALDGVEPGAERAPAPAGGPEPAGESGGFVRLTSPPAAVAPAAEEKQEAASEPIEIDRDSLRRPREPARSTATGGTGGAPAGVVLDAGTLNQRRSINQVVGGGGGRQQLPNRRPPMFEPPRDFVPGRESTGRIERGLEPVDPARPAIG